MIEQTPQYHDVKVRSSLASYFMLWVPLILLAGLNVVIAINGDRNTWGVVVMLGVIGIIGSVILMRKHILLLSESVVFRNIFNSVRIPINVITSVKGTSIGREQINGIPRGPGFLLIIETVTGEKQKQLSISMKPFRRSDLRDFFITVKSRGIPVYVNDVVRTIIQI